MLRRMRAQSMMRTFCDMCPEVIETERLGGWGCQRVYSKCVTKQGHLLSTAQAGVSIDLLHLLGCLSKYGIDSP